MDVMHHAWSIVLAGGEGTRLRNVAIDAAGQCVPKQYCSLRGGASLLQEALARAAATGPAEHVCAVVAAEHRRWWQHIADVAPGNLVVQPENRGTAHGILLPMLSVLRRDPGAQVLVLPADHHVEQEPIFRAAMQMALSSVQEADEAIFLLGIEPEYPDPELGYVVPTARPGQWCSMTVAKFVEKPPRAQAQELIAQGALWNSFMLAGRGSALLRLIERRVPENVALLQQALQRGPESLADVYRSLSSVDFSRDVLAGCETQLRVLRVPQCGWNDLGTPLRLTRVLRRSARTAVPSRGPVFVDLSRIFQHPRTPQAAPARTLRISAVADPAAGSRTVAAAMLPRAVGEAAELQAG